jgi:hypothetical protein
VFFDELSDLQLAVGIVCDAIFCHVSDLVLLELQIVKRVLEVVEIHVLLINYIYMKNN